MGEGPDGGGYGAWLEVEDHGVVVVGGVHSLEGRMGVEHGGLGICHKGGTYILFMGYIISVNSFVISTIKVVNVLVSLAKNITKRPPVKNRS